MSAYWRDATEDRNEVYEGATLGDTQGDLETKGWKEIEVLLPDDHRHDQTMIAGYGQVSNDRVIEFAWNEGEPNFQLSFLKGAKGPRGAYASSFPMVGIPTPDEAEKMLVLEQVKKR